MKPLVPILPTVQAAPFREPKDRTDITALSDWSRGGITLSDGTQGMEIQDWNYTVEGTGVGTGIWLQDTLGNYPHTLQLSAPNITWMRGTFDQNMHPAVSYISNGNSFLWWFDPLTHVQETLPLAPGLILPTSAIKSPTVVMDDTRDRESLLGNNDIILAYILADGLYFRLERDRYGVEHFWTSDFTPFIDHPFINKMGMGIKWRFQVEIQEAPL